MQSKLSNADQFKNQPSTSSVNSNLQPKDRSSQENKLVPTLSSDNNIRSKQKSQSTISKEQSSSKFGNRNLSNDQFETNSQENPTLSSMPHVPQCKANGSSDNENENYDEIFEIETNSK